MYRGILFHQVSPRSPMAFSTPKVLRTLRTAHIVRPTLQYQGFSQICRCAYHSYEYEAPPPFPAVETAMLSAALAHVPTHGFTTTALCHGARDANYRDVSINLFPAGAFALVNYHLVTQRLALAKSRPSRDQSASTGAGVRRLVWTRLYANVPIIHRWQEVGCFVSGIPNPLRNTLLHQSPTNLCFNFFRFFKPSARVSQRQFKLTNRKTIRPLHF